MQAAVQYARIGGTLPLSAPYFDIFYAGAVLYVFYLWIGVRGFKTGACADSGLVKNCAYEFPLPCTWTASGRHGRICPRRVALSAVRHGDGVLLVTWPDILHLAVFS
jgi:hypothetical protein